MVGWLKSVCQSRILSLDQRIYRLLQEQPLLDRDQIAATLRVFDKSAIDDALHLLQRQQLACPHPDPSMEAYPNDKIPWGLWIPWQTSLPSSPAA